MKTSKPIATLGAALALSLLGVVGTAAPASAAGCYGYNCHGYDMNYKGCSASGSLEAAAVDARGVVLGYVWNRYSAGCRSNWTEAELSPAAIAAGDTMSTQMQTTDSRGYSELMEDPTTQDNRGLLHEARSGTHGAGHYYGDMVDGTNVTEADILIYDSRGSYITYGYADQ